MGEKGKFEGEIIIEEKVIEKAAEGKTRSNERHPDKGSGWEGIASQVRELAQKIPESISKVLETALSGREQVVMVRVNDEAITKLDHLVEAGIFKSRSESAAFLINEGINAQGILFEKIADKIDEINRLRSELKSIVEQEVNKQ
jgi:Arc/MetJ-type ribon-helix-helix transcriptional regulator